MEHPHQFSLGYLFLILFWFALSLGLWRVAPSWRYFGYPAFVDIGQLLQVLMLASMGAAVGGFFKRMWIGAILGACSMVVWLTLVWAVDELLAWLTPI
jgi:hypothetical protein